MFRFCYNLCGMAGNVRTDAGVLLMRISNLLPVHIFQIRFAAFMCFVLAGNLLLCGCRKEQIRIISSEHSAGQDEDNSFSDLSDGAESETGNETEKDSGSPAILVHVCGAVNSPGVYELEKGARLFEAVEAAGGFRDEADREWCNLAAEVCDGDKLKIYTLEETKEFLEEGIIPEVSGIPESPGKDEVSGTADGRVNINTAGLAALVTLPGIGQSKAQSIIDYRTANGAFSCVDDLAKVKGIGPAVLEKLRPFATI